MPLTKEQAQQIKNQLLENLPSFPENQKDLIKQKILSLSPNELEEFLKQNNLAKQECIFCSIVANQTPSHKISENQENIAILEINPAAKGHILIVPKKHSQKMSESAKEIASQIIKKIKFHLKPKDISAKQTNIMGHQLIEIIPVYDDKPTERKKASESELQELQKLLIKPAEKQPVKIKEEIPKLPPRIP